jgi:RNA-directed DNA polymerase
MTTTPEPKGKLDSMATSTPAAAASSSLPGVAVLNGPEDEPLDWFAIDWQTVEEDVRRLRQRIFTASQAGDLKRVRNLQKLMLRSRANTLVSVRRVTEQNAGRKTAGIDGAVVLLPQAKAELADWAQRRTEPWQARPVKRVFIPKAGGKQRPLGIPVVVDRVLQARVVNALEPEWEARFEPRSYGFGRAVAAMTRSMPSSTSPGARTPSDVGCSTRTWRRRSTGSTMTTCSASSARSQPGD